MRLITAVGILLLACARKAPAPEQSQPAFASASAPAPSVSAAPVPSDPIHTASAATFKNDKLAACIDLGIVSPIVETAARKVDASVADAVADEASVFLAGGDTMIGRLLDVELGKAKAARLAAGGEPQVLTRACAEQFAGRAVIGSCFVKFAHRSDSGTETRVAFALNHYDALVSDKAMQACLAVKGQWSELHRDSLEFRAQQRRQLLDESLKALN